MNNTRSFWLACTLAATIIPVMAAPAKTSVATKTKAASTPNVPATFGASAATNGARSTPAASSISAVSGPLALQESVVVPGSGHFDYLSSDEKLGRIFAAHPGTETLTVFDLQTKQVQAIATGKVNCAVADEADGKVFVAGAGQAVVVLDRKTLAKIATVPLTGPADAMALDPKRHRLYIDHDDGAEAWVLDTRTNKLVGSVALPGVPEYVLYDAASDRLYQAIKDKNVIVVIDPQTNRVSASYQTAPLTSPHGLAINPATHHLFVAGAGKAAMLDARDGRLLSTIDITPGYVDQIAFDAKNGRLYCACGAGTLAVLQESATGLGLLGFVPTSNRTHTVTIGKNSDVWVASDVPSGDALLHFTPVQSSK